METKWIEREFLAGNEEEGEEVQENSEEGDRGESYTEEEIAQLRALAEQENSSIAQTDTDDNLHILIGDTCLGSEISEYEDSEEALSIIDGGRKNGKIINEVITNRNLSYMLKNLYIVNPTTSIDKKIFDVDKLLDMDCTIKKSKEPQILIFHTHGASEHFSDSREGEKEDSVIGVGGRLAEILSKEYGYCVIHDETPYDLIDGEIDRNTAYTVAEEKLAEVLEKYPTIQVMIDLHRDASSDGKTKRVTVIDGKKCAKVMLFNGLSRNQSGDIKYLYNPNLQGNLGFSLQMKLKAMEYYEDFTLPIFLKGYRYSLHLREKSLLVELGNEVNTVNEAKNAMEPFARVLDAVLSGK